MKSSNLTTEQLNALNPRAIVLAQYIGSDDIFTCNGEDIITMFQEDGDGPPNATLSEALHWSLRDVSGNSYDVVFLQDGELVKVSFPLPCFNPLLG
jgi:hypothetical protein